MLAEYSDLLGIATEQDVPILADELESLDPGDLIRRVEDLLGRTKATRRTQTQEKSSDLSVEVSKPGRIIHMSESGCSKGGVLEVQEAALENVMTD